ncbi:MAG: FkbM family methyltransferase, partial [Bacteroidota bacterium]
WKQNGSKVPPPHAVKQELVVRHAREYGCHILVETGTYLGDMVQAMKGYFSSIYSIELGEELAQKASTRFDSSKHIQVVSGDSSSVLGPIVQNLTGRTLFWLDGHYSGGITAKGDKDCPVVGELKSIMTLRLSLGHVILIDDARLFTGENSYPTIEEIKALLQNEEVEYKVEVENDCIKCLPNLN